MPPKKFRIVVVVLILLIRFNLRIFARNNKRHIVIDSLRVVPSEMGDQSWIGLGVQSLLSKQQ
mgnify:CR=1 FL=1